MFVCIYLLSDEILWEWTAISIGNEAMYVYVPHLSSMSQAAHRGKSDFQKINENKMLKKNRNKRKEW